MKAIPFPHRRARAPSSRRGFTLIELMVTVAVVAILASLALPAYRNYMVRGKLVAGTNALAALRAQMEQFYQDNRQYTTLASGTVTLASPCAASSTVDTFTLACSNLSTTTYTLTATGSGLTNGAVYTVDQTNNQSTSSLPIGWGSPPSGNHCWIMRKGDSC